MRWGVEEGMRSVQGGVSVQGGGGARKKSDDQEILVKILHKLLVVTYPPACRDASAGFKRQ